MGVPQDPGPYDRAGQRFEPGHPPPGNGQGPHAPAPHYGRPQAPGYGAQPPPYGAPAQYGAPQYGAPQYGAPPPGPPPPRRSSGGRVVLIVVGVLVVLLVGAGIAIFQAVSGITNRVSDLAEGVGTTCDAVPTADVDTALGGTYEVIQLGGFGGLAAPILDSRVLADAPTCWAVETGDGGRLARIARYSGPDAAARFAEEKRVAMGVTEDRGNGLSVSTDGYFAGDTASGDEAFCTSGDATAAAGVLVRRGDLLVYVSTTAAGAGAASVPDIDFDSEQLSFATDEANCRLATALADRVR